MSEKENKIYSPIAVRLTNNKITALFVFDKKNQKIIMCDATQRVIEEMPVKKDVIDVAIAKHNFLPLNEELKKLEFNKDTFDDTVKVIESKIARIKE